MAALADVAREKLHALTETARKRELRVSARETDAYVTRGDKRFISFSCNDYLGLSQHPKVKAAAIAAIEKYGVGAGASRLVTGNHPLYEELEKKLADSTGMESVLVFGSGYLTNLGVIPALVGKDDLILADRLVHACLIDGAQLSGAKLKRFKHNDVEDCARLLEANHAHHRHVLIITDAVFSMDGDIAPLAELSQLATKYDAWLMADAAHSLTFPDVHVNIIMGTLSKALGSYGGYVAGAKDVIDYLSTSARSLMFSTGLPPSVIASSIAALDIAKGNPSLLSKPHAKARLFTKELGLPMTESSIVPLILGEEAAALDAAKELEEAGYLVVAIRPPTVPEGTSRLRFAFSALHKDDDIVKLAKFIKDKGWV